MITPIGVRMEWRNGRVGKIIFWELELNMIKYLSTVIILFGLIGNIYAEYADSVWLDYQEGLSRTGDIIMTDMAVEQTAIYTYYAGLVWNNGYMGLQRGGSGYFKHVHFSVWDPTTGGFAELIWADSDVVTKRFGGEGTGWKAMWPFDWVEGKTYRLCVTLEHVSLFATDYTAHFYNPDTGTWKHIATFRRLDGEHSFSYISSFVEDFGSTINSPRSCLFGNAWLHTFNDEWCEIRKARYATGGSKINKDADVVGQLFRLETGGDTIKDTSSYSLLVRDPSKIKPSNRDLYDWAVFSENWGTYAPNLDFNYDGTVDIYDVNEFAKYWLCDFPCE